MNKKLKKLNELNFNDKNEKKDYNSELFTIVAPKYNFLTKVLSFFRDYAWKKMLIKTLPNLDEPLCVDIACGTGDITKLLALKYPNGSITGVDLNEKMLEIASKKVKCENIDFKRMSMDDMDFKTLSMDIITGGYALRNAPDIKTTLIEFNRILKDGGTVALLDFAKSNSKLAQKTGYFLLWFWGSLWGLILHGNSEVYAYIAESLKNYPDNIELIRIIKDSGFKNISKKTLMFGLLSIITFEK